MAATTSKPHWTQTEAGRRKMARVQKQAWAWKKAKTRKSAALIPVPLVHDRPITAHSLHPKSVARQEVLDLARLGARTRLIELEKECAKLRMYLGIEEREEEFRERT